MVGSQIVLDTNVVVSALRSRRGRSYQLLMRVDSGKFEINLSVPLLFEYEDACKRLVGQILLTTQEVDDVLDYLCRVANQRQVFFLWRPFLADPKDDLILELAVSARCDCIVTHNQRDFGGVQQFGIRIRTPKEFLREIGEIP